MSMTKNRVILFLSFLFFPLAINAQKEIASFGDVSAEELSMKYYSDDSSAAAVILFDTGESEIVYNNTRERFELIFKRHVRIKILTREGLNYADFEIPLYSSSGRSESLSRLRAFTFNDNGGKIERTRLSNSSIFNEKRTDNLSYTIFTLPNVQEGSVIDISYEVISEFLYNLPDWEFQFNIPVDYSSYSTTIPEYFNYRQHIAGYEDVVISEKKGNRNIMYTQEISSRKFGITANASSRREQRRLDYAVEISTYTAKKVPALPVESFVDNRNNYRSLLQYELLTIQLPNSPIRQFSTNWDAIVKDLLNHADFGGQMNRSRYMRNDLQHLQDANQDSEALLVSAFEFVRQNIGWDGNYRFFASDGARNAYTHGIGNSAEVNFNLINVLQELDFEVYPVAISTKSNGRILPHQVTMSGFNHVIVLVWLNDEIILLDATSRHLDPFLLPYECLNEQGRLISREVNDWVELNPQNRAVSNLILSSGLDENLHLFGTTKTRYTNHVSIFFYTLTHADESKDKLREYFSELYLNATINIEKASINKDNFSHFDCSLSFHTEEAALSSGNMLYINPMIGFEFDLNPFRSPTRKLPVNFNFPREIRYLNKIKIPEGYIIEDSPEDISVSLPDGSCNFIFSTQQMNDELVISVRMIINRIIFPPDEYPDLKAFFDLVLQKQEEKIVLKKSSPKTHE